MDPELLEILACPLCKGGLEYQADKRRLLCRGERLAYPITEDGIPVLLAQEAVLLADDDG